MEKARVLLLLLGDTGKAFFSAGMLICCRKQMKGVEL
jgi:hypothetical protein